MANFINKYLNQSAYDADSTKQYPNTSLVGNGIVFQMTEPFGGLTVKYNFSASEIENEVALFQGGGGSSESESSSESGGGGAMPTKMYVDGVEETPINTWRFETAGEHIVQYEFEDYSVPELFLNTFTYIPEIIVGTEITAINDNAFNSCSGLTSVTVEATTPPSLGVDALLGTNDCPIYVPSTSVNTYKAAANWSTYASRIEAIQ